MRFGLIFLVLLFAIAGAAFGALNSQAIELDFYFATLTLVKGGVVLGALLVGWILGGLLVYLSLVLPLRRRLRVQSRRIKQLEADARRHSAAGALAAPVLDA